MMSVLSKNNLLVGSFIPVTTPSGAAAAPSKAEMLKANILANLTFYRRSKLLWAFTLIFLAMMSLDFLPAIFRNSTTTSFNSLQEFTSWLTVLIMILSAGLGLFVISSHIRSRSLKMVFTKPCSPGLWLFSAMLSGVLASLLLTCIVYAATVGLSFFWHLPVRTGLAYICLDTFIASIGVMAYMVLLASLMHPAIAVAVALIFNAEIFLSFETWARGMIRGGNHSWFLRALQRFFQVLYIALPAFNPLGKETKPIYEHIRVSHGDWRYILYSLGYSLVLSAFCYFIALFALERRRHI
jgi:ABC-type transport system involved in multi-copper enzyme maturation permease subunit